MRRLPWALRFAIFASALLAPVLVARAMTVVPIADDDLALSVRAIVDGQIQRLETVWSSERRAVVTYVTVRVDESFKGPLESGTIVLRQVGGRTAHHATEISGAPQFEVGQRVVLFLNTDADGALRVAHVSMGLYRVVPDPTTNRPLVIRASEATRIDPIGQKGRVTETGFKDEFLRAVTTTLATRRAEAEGYLARHGENPLLTIPPEYVPGLDRGDDAAPSYTFLPPGFRWFEPDSGRIVPVRLNGREAPTATRGVDEARSAIATWSSISGSRFVATYAGASSGGGHRPNGLNEIAFGDPLHEIDDPVNCTGVVATSGVTATSANSTVINGLRFVGITEADVVVNNGFECVLSDSILMAEILTHEFGHTIGLGHSSQRVGETNEVLRDATMYFIAHNDGRRSSVRTDDSEAVRLLYPAAISSKPLALVSGTVPDALPGVAYAVDLRAVDGLTPRVWTVVSGFLPDGIVLTQDGRLGGTSTTIGTFTFYVRLVDARGAEIEQGFTFRVTDQPSPFLLRAAYKVGPQKLQITGVYLDASAVVVVNGVALEGVNVKYSSRKGRITVRGSQSALNLSTNGANTIEVEVDGRRSNAVAF